MKNLNVISFINYHRATWTLLIEIVLADILILVNKGYSNAHLVMVSYTSVFSSVGKYAHVSVAATPA